MIAFIATALAGWLVFSDVAPRNTELFGWMQGGTKIGMIRDDAFARFFKGFTLLGTLIAIPMSMSHRALAGRRMGEWYALLLGTSLGMFVMASATHLLMFFLGVEFASMASYLLTAFVKRDLKGSEAGMKYAIYGSVASVRDDLRHEPHLRHVRRAPYLGSRARVHRRGHHADRAPRRGRARVRRIRLQDGRLPDALLVPGHLRRRSDALRRVPLGDVEGRRVRGLHSLPDGVRARFPGRNEGRAHPLDWKALVTVACVASMTLGNLGALLQDNVKRLLAYSSIAHAGYLLMGVVVLAPGAGSEQLRPLLFYFIAYLFMNLGAFYVVLAIESREGVPATIRSFAGIGRRSPILGVCMTLFLFSLIGIPPTAGFTGKWMLLNALIKQPQPLVWLAVVAGLNTAISAYYYFKLVRRCGSTSRKATPRWRSRASPRA
jgi:NADH-quinone oxidoreductase subunit N